MDLKSIDKETMQVIVEIMRKHFVAPKDYQSTLAEYVRIWEKNMLFEEAYPFMVNADTAISKAVTDILSAFPYLKRSDACQIASAWVQYRIYQMVAEL